MSLESVTETLNRRAMDFTGLGALVKFDFGSDGRLCVDARETPPVISQEDGEADCTIRVSIEDLEKLMAGALNPTLAYTMGRLKVDGSLGLAMKLAARLED